MGILNWLGLGNVPATSPQFSELHSPWTNSGLTPSVIMADAIGIKDIAVTRDVALTVPAIKAARDLVVSTLSRQPLRAYKNADLLADQPAWLYSTSSGIPPQHRMADIIDDLFFYGWSVLAVERGTKGQVIDAVRIHPSRWTFDNKQRIVIDNHTVNQNDVVLIRHSSEGILTTCARTIRGAIKLEQQWSNRVENPIPVTELHNTDPNNELKPDEAKLLVEQYNANRRNPDGITVYTPSHVEIRTHGDAVVNLFVEGRNAVKLDVANMTGVPATMLDASQVASSLTYSTKQESRSNFIDAIVNLYASPIEWWLSMDNVCPRGTRLAFDLENLLSVPQSTTGPATED